MATAAAGTVVLLQTSPTDGDTAGMESHEEIECLAGIGIAGDRYALDPQDVASRPVEIEGAVSDMGGQYPERANTHWHLPEVGRQLTLFDSGALQRLVSLPIREGCPVRLLLRKDLSHSARNGESLILCTAHSIPIHGHTHRCRHTHMHIQRPHV